MRVVPWAIQGKKSKFSSHADGRNTDKAWSVSLLLFAHLQLVLVFEK